MKQLASTRLVRRTIVGLAVLGLALGLLASNGLRAPRGAGTATPATKLTAADLLLAASTAQSGIFLQFDGVTGAPSHTHTNHAPVSSYSWGVTRTAQISGSSRSIQSPSATEIRLTRPVDKYSVPLLQNALTGTGDTNAVIYFTKVQAGGKALDYLEFDLQHVLVSSESMHSSGNTPSESLTLNFTHVAIKAQLAGAPVQRLSFNLLTTVGGP